MGEETGGPAPGSKSSASFSPQSQKRSQLFPPGHVEAPPGWLDQTNPPLVRPLSDLDLFHSPVVEGASVMPGGKPLTWWLCLDQGGGKSLDVGVNGQSILCSTDLGPSRRPSERSSASPTTEGCGSLRNRLIYQLFLSLSASFRPRRRYRDVWKTDPSQRPALRSLLTLQVSIL